MKKKVKGKKRRDWRRGRGGMEGEDEEKGER
jgi:hypothetical protein